MKEEKQSFLSGVMYSLISCGLFIGADAIDEYCLNKECLLNAVLVVFLPMLALICYAVHTLRKRPSAGQLLFWHSGMALAFLPVWFMMCYGAIGNMNWFPVYQARRGAFIDLNGLEYVFFGYTALVWFTIFCIAFHVLRFVIKKLCERKEAAAA